MNHLTARQNLPASIQPQMVEEIPYLLPDQIAALPTAFQEWYDDASIRPSTRKPVTGWRFSSFASPGPGWATCFHLTMLTISITALVMSSW